MNNNVNVRLPNWVRAPDVGCILFLIVSYFAVVGLLLVANRFLPLITDYNETFSALAHASNIYNFGFRGTFGLTDETISPFAAAGPYVYTHLGNFPRFFALLIYIFGARSPELQILITAATIGFGGYILAFHFFSRRAGVGFAAIYCLLFITDYMMVLQWQLVTWQVWRFLFLFLSLILVDRLRERASAPLAAGAILCFACLNYYDIPFSVFVGAAAIIYGITNRQSWRSRVLIVGIVGTGLFIGAIVLVTQSILALGWDVFLQDLRNTYLARNEMSPGAAGLKAVQAFYANHHIVFWPNFFNASAYRMPAKFIGALFHYVFSVYTPFTTSIALIVGGMTAVASFGVGPKPTVDERVSAYMVAPIFLVAVVWCGVASIFAFGGTISEILVRGLFVGVALLAVLYNLCFGCGLVPSVSGESQIPDRRLWLGSGWLFVVGFILFGSSTLYNAQLAPLFREIESIVGGTLIANLWLILALWVGAKILIGGTGDSAPGVKILVRVLISGFIGYVVVILFSPGYVITTVLNRLTPLTVGFHLIVFALAIFGCGRLLLASWSRASISGSVRVEFAGSAAVLAVFLVAWGAAQIVYAARLPGDTYKIFKALRGKEFQGTSFIVDGYAAPVGIVSKSWAYIDYTLWHGRVRVGADGYEVENDKTFLWFRDRDSNPSYRYPQYFVCLIQRDVNYVVANSKHLTCATRDLVRIARHGGNTLLTPEEVLRDPSSQDRWSILRLHWNFPAYLKPLGEGGSYVEVSGDRVGDKYQFAAAFQLVQRDDRVSGINYRLYSLGSCTSVTRDLIRASSRNGLAIDPHDGVYQIGVELLPTKSRVAVEFFSHPLRLKSGRLQKCHQALPGHAFVFRNVSNSTR